MRPAGGIFAPINTNSSKIHLVLSVLCLNKQVQWPTLVCPSFTCNNIKIASVLCFDYKNCRLLYNSGYNPEYSHYSVGILLKTFCIRDAIEEGKDYFDFLKGNESYKYNMGGQDKLLYSMEISSWSR